MIRNRSVVTTLSVLWLAALAGCMPKMTKEDMKAMKPQRPAQLDTLNMLAGKWETTAEMKVAGLDELMTGKGTSTSAWDADGMLLVEHSEFEMGDMGKMKGIGLWTYDPKAHRYRMWWFDSWGASGKGTSRYDEATKTWHMKMKARGPMGGTRSKGTMHMPDNNTMEWSFQEYPSWDLFGFIKLFDMKGTSKRKG